MAKSCGECDQVIRKIFGSVKTFVLHNNKEMRAKTYTCPHCKAVYTADQYNRLKDCDYGGA